jgi:hypothetical protein
MKSYGADQTHSKCPISYETQLGFIAKESFVAKVYGAQRLQAKSPTSHLWGDVERRDARKYGARKSVPEF